MEECDLGKKRTKSRSQCPTPLPLLLSLAQFVESIAQRRKKHAHTRSSSRSQGPNPTAATYTKRMPNLINSLPDECLQEIFGYLPRAQDRCVCALVCMRWLLLQSRMHRHDFETVAVKCQDHLHHKSECVSSGGLLLDSEKAHSRSKAVQGGSQDFLSEVKGPAPLLSGKDDPAPDKPVVERQPQGAVRDLSWSLEGRKATDVQLAFTALGTLACGGGLGKLSIEGGATMNGSKGVSNDGLLAVGNC